MLEVIKEYPAYRENPEVSFPADLVLYSFFKQGVFWLECPGDKRQEVPRFILKLSYPEEVLDYVPRPPSRWPNIMVAVVLKPTR